MALNLGSGIITAVYLGTTSIATAYLGETLVFGGLSPYAVNGFEPEMVASFENEYFRENGVDSTFSSMFNVTRASSATYYDSTGDRVTVTNGVARTFNHKWSGSSWVPVGLLIEPARTNLERNSASPSLGVSGTVGATRTTGVADREGGTTGNLLTGSGSGLHFAAFSNSQISYVNTQYYCKTFDLKAYGSQRYVAVVAAGGGFTGNGRNVIFDLTLGTITFEETGTNDAVGFIQDLGGGWYRCTGVFRCSSSISPPDGYYLSLTNSATVPTPSYTASASNGVYYEAVQIENSVYPTSLIPTSGTAVTRAADVISVKNTAMPTVSGDVTVHLKGEIIYQDTNAGAVNNGLSGQCVPFSWYNNTSNYVAAQMETATGTGAMYFTQENSGSIGQTSTTASRYAPGVDASVPINIAATFGGATNATVEGTALTEDTTPTAIADLSGDTMRLCASPLSAMNITLITVTADDVQAAGRLEMTT